MIGLAPEDLADLRRWAISGMIVVFAYGGIAAAMVNWRDPVDQAEPAGAIVVEFAPMPVLPPEQVQSDAVPDKPIEKVEEKVEAKAEEEIKEKVQPKPVEEPPRAAVPMTTPPAPAPQIAALPAAPVEGKPDPAATKAMQVWMGQLSARLERNKRYPAAAAAQREKRTVEVFFSLDRQGRVVESRILKSSGVAAFDQEALAVLHRAEPFPVWPREQFAGEHLPLTLPVIFPLK
jgi:protein TonB